MSRSSNENVNCQREEPELEEEDGEAVELENLPPQEEQDPPQEIPEAAVHQERMVAFEVPEHLADAVAELIAADERPPPNGAAYRFGDEDEPYNSYSDWWVRVGMATIALGVGASIIVSIILILNPPKAPKEG